jgi:hypothetical protein
MVFGYYRKVLRWDFRASGMNLLEKRELPEQAIRMAREVNRIIKSPMLVVDMLQGLDGRYSIIEFSPLCQVETPEQLHVNGVPGVYVFDNDDSFHFEKGRYWVHELALKEFLSSDYLPRVSGNEKKAPGMLDTKTLPWVLKKVEEWPSRQDPPGSNQSNNGPGEHR